VGGQEDHVTCGFLLERAAYVGEVYLFVRSNGCVLLPLLLGYVLLRCVLLRCVVWCCVLYCVMLPNPLHLSCWCLCRLPAGSTKAQLSSPGSQTSFSTSTYDPAPSVSGQLGETDAERGLSGNDWAAAL
jgi:hypothetical protein